ncbi:MAG: insulinase family protein [Thermoflavifilum aggregans]|nr:insulinase family protein [Thermoflavifilum aggregans]
MLIHTLRKFRRHRNSALLLVLGLLIICLFHPQQTAAQQHVIRFEKYQLPNGLTVILHRDTTVPVVAVTMMYHVGSKNETPGLTGFAHFFEHLMFEGSKYIPRKSFEKYITNAGGSYNANTTQDRTFFYEVLPSNQLALGLWLESERLLHLKIDSIGVNTQREVVKEEKRLRVDNQPYGTILIEILKRAFSGPYHWSPIGSMDDINRAQLGQFLQFYHTYYVPNNAILSIAGNIEIDSTKKLIQAYFGSIPKGKTPIPRPDPNEPPLTHEIKDTIYDHIQLPAVIEAYRMPKETSPEYYAAQVLATALSGGPSSRLNTVVKDQKQLALAVASIPYFNEDAGLLINYAIANMHVNPDSLQQAIDEEVHKLTTQLLPEKEFEKIMNQIQTDVVTSNSTMLGIAESLANYQMFFGDANLINTELQKYQQVTREDVLQVAKKYLRPDNRVVLYYLPISQKQAAGE